MNRWRPVPNGWSREASGVAALEKRCFEGVAPQISQRPFSGRELCIGPLSEPPGTAGTRSEVCTPICVPLGRSLTFPRISALIKEAKTSIFFPTYFYRTAVGITGDDR